MGAATHGWQLLGALAAAGLALFATAGAGEPEAALELLVLGDSALPAGGPAALRVQAERRAGVFRAQPAAELEVELWSEPRGAGGEGAGRLLARGRTDARGGLELRFEAPDAAPPDSVLVVRAAGEDAESSRPLRLLPGLDAASRLRAVGRHLLVGPACRGPLPEPATGLRLAHLPGSSARVGGELRVRLEASDDAAAGPALLELVQAGRALRSLALDLASGPTELRLPLEPGWEGPAVLRSWALGPLGPEPGARLPLLIEPAAPLEVRAMRFAPFAARGQPLRLRVQVLDGAGQGRRAQLSILAGPPAGCGSAPGDEPGGTLPWPSPGLDARRAVPGSVARALEAYGQENQAWWRLSVLDVERDAWAPPEDVLSRLVLRGLLPEAEALDPWGRPWTLSRQGAARGKGRLRFLALDSQGEDGRPGSADDLRLPLGQLALPEEPPALGAERVPALEALELGTDGEGLVELELPAPAKPGPFWVVLLARGDDGALGWSRLRIEPR